MKGPWDEEQLLAAFRDERGPGSLAEDRLWARLRADIEGTPRQRSRQRSTWIVAAFACAAAAVVVIAWPEPRVLDAQSSEAPSLLPHERDGGSEGDVAQASAPRASTREAPLPVDAEADAPADAPADVVAPDAVEPAKSRAPRSKHRAPREPAESAPPVEQDSLAAETQLLRRARASLSRGNFEQALAVLAEYEREHPNGLLAEEADAVLTIAKCRSTPSQGADLARSFAARHGGSLFRAQVQAACVLEAGDG
jgi:hypothetical protein